MMEGVRQKSVFVLDTIATSHIVRNSGDDFTYSAGHSRAHQLMGVGGRRVECEATGTLTLDLVTSAGLTHRHLFDNVLLCPMLFGPSNTRKYRGVLSVIKAAQEGFTFVAGPLGVSLRHPSGSIAVTTINQMYEIVSDPGPTDNPVRLRLPALLAACAPTAGEEKAYRDFGLRARTLIDEEPLPGSCITEWSAHADKLRNIGSSFSKRLQRDLLRPKSGVLLKVKRKEKVSVSCPAAEVFHLLTNAEP